MINLGLRSEFTFKECYAPIKKIANMGFDVVGIADKNNTFSHVILEKECKEKNIKPIFGVRLEVVPDDKLKTRGFFGPEYILIAKDQFGLSEINKLTSSAWENFYYKPMVKFSDLILLSDSVFVICENPFSTERLDFICLSLTTPLVVIDALKDCMIPSVFIQQNRYMNVEDKDVYQLLAGTVKRADGYSHKFEAQTHPQHILNADEARV